MILHIAAILTKGATLPDGNKIQNPMTVIYQCSEDSKGDTIKPRLERAGADCRKVAFIKDDDGDLTLDDERIELAVKMTGARLLVLDPIQAFIGKNGNMQSAVRMRETMTKLANIASRICLCDCFSWTHEQNQWGKEHIQGTWKYRYSGSCKKCVVGCQG
ncbi:MAG: AAA family ATPase [Blautia sp.]